MSDICTTTGRIYSATSTQPGHKQHEGPASEKDCFPERTHEVRPVKPGYSQNVISHVESTGEGMSWSVSYNAALQTVRLVTSRNPVHDTPQAWIQQWLEDMMATDSLALSDRAHLKLDVGTTFTKFSGKYAASYKKSDFCITPVWMDFPTVVIENGWSESRDQLHDDRDMWLKGGHGLTQIVIVLKWSENDDKEVHGDVEIFELDRNGVVRSTQKETVFPAPACPEVAASQYLTITKGQLWGPVATTQEKDQSLKLNIDYLRAITTRKIEAYGLTPAK
ncbi:hypothetical protein AWENTII_006789 [Aspergillus wentii]